MMAARVEAARVEAARVENVQRSTSKRLTGIITAEDIPWPGRGTDSGFCG